MGWLNVTQWGAQVGHRWSPVRLTLGYRECLGQPSMETMILCPASVAAWRVSMRILGMRLSAGVKRWRVDWKPHKDVHTQRDTQRDTHTQTYQLLEIQVKQTSVNGQEMV